MSINKLQGVAEELKGAKTFQGDSGGFKRIPGFFSRLHRFPGETKGLSIGLHRFQWVLGELKVRFKGLLNRFQGVSGLSERSLEDFGASQAVR